ncbi:signal transduction histidine kinase [Pedobacter nutrimenti]|uniref:histidine kinase n=1 Tax=Pedobacter nutrimenti TaxID=1241337 RepID=A0A318US93_9SPHI|nr:signal transduction histidine kinase [Pedobacter nutrimenti]
MKLSSKLLFFITGSKLAIVILFILLLPSLVKQIALEYTNYTLKEQKKKVLDIVQKNGLHYYLEKDSAYGSYTMLKEEYISLAPAAPGLKIDTIKNSRRIVEKDTLNYRILSYTFKNSSRNYLLEIGKTTASINQYDQPLQRFALYVLMVLVLLTILIDLTFTRVLIRPLTKIISTRLVNRKFPFKEQGIKIKTSTTDFKYLDESLSLLTSQINDAFTKEKEFTANASHELMTPISILQHKMENLLADQQVSESVSLRIIEMMKSLDRLKKISSSLLLISRIENEQFVKRDQVRPLELFREIKEEIGHRLEAQNISLVLELSSALKLKNVNQDLLFQLFYNITNNAIKFNKTEGKILVSDAFLKHGEYQIRISDTGIGIEPGQLPFIFDRFRKSNLSEKTGYGLGLAIVKSIALYHNIKVEVQSVPNEGTTFFVSFPADQLD